jgi:hypothetical protein
MKTIKIKSWGNGEVPKNFTGILECPDGSRRWYKNDKLHRTHDGGPAIEHTNGYKMWFKDGKWHREDGGPAIIRPEGDKLWYRNGKRHRTDGPAIEWRGGEVAYYINDKKTYKEAVEVYAALFPKKEVVTEQ